MKRRSKKTDFLVPAERRRLILVLEKRDVERLSYEKGGANVLLDQRIQVVTYSPDAPDRTLEILLGRGLAQPGRILVQSPYDSDTYVDLADAPVEFALAKILHFSAFCKRLGAREVRVHEHDRATQRARGRHTVSLDLAGPATGLPSAKARADSKLLSRLKQEIQLLERYEGGAPDTAAAERILTSTRLGGDAQMRHLLENAKLPENRQLEHDLRLDVLKETRATFEWVASLGVPDFLNVRAKGLERRFEKLESSVRVTVRFPE